MASSWSCVTCTNVMPTSVWIRFSSICIWRRSLRSRAPEGLVEQEQLGPVDQGPGQRDPLLLAPGELRRLALAEAAQLDELEHLLHLRQDPLRAPPAQPEGHVLGDREMREQRVALEDGIHGALVGPQFGDVVVPEQDPAVGRLLQARDHAQRRGLAAARRSEQGEERPRRHGQREVVDRREDPEPLGDADDPQVARARAVAAGRLTHR